MIYSEIKPITIFGKPGLKIGIYTEDADHYIDSLSAYLDQVDGVNLVKEFLNWANDRIKELIENESSIDYIT